jgi:putative glutamine amidotransferase
VRLRPGSPADVNPALYGAERDPGCGPVDEPREIADRVMLDHAAETAKPVLGICYGIQLLNVWRGGTLIQDLTPLPVNHSAGSKVAVAHSALIAKHTLLADILQGTEAVDDPADSNYLRLPINTSHHQSVLALGDELRIVARSPEDGVVEAVELPYKGGEAQFFLGIQWHPERSFDISAASRALFARLVAEASKVAEANGIAGASEIASRA